MAIPEPPPTSLAAPPRPRVLWIGATAGTELGLAHAWLSERTQLLAADTPGMASTSFGVEPSGPALVVLATDCPGRWSLADALLIARRWPLALIVSVGTSLVDGRRRSGPPLPGVEEVAWHDLAGRLDGWLAAFAAGRPGALGLPTTARREERLLAATDAARESRDNSPEMEGRATVSVAAAQAADLEGLVDLLALSGRRIVRQTRGRPRLDEPAAVLVWDVGHLEDEDLAWLRMLAANRPRLGIVVLESFPRGDSTAAALLAGAYAVLGRPVALEALAGTLARLEAVGLVGPSTGLGPVGEHR